MPDVARIDLEQWSLEIPLSDFDHLPQELGCSVHRRGLEITLAPDRPGCEATFAVHDNVAVLQTVKIESDPGGWFLRDVVGLLFQVYSGDLVAQVTWSGGGQEETRLVFRDGETTHPFLLEVVTEEFAWDALQTALDEAEAAWAEYQRLKRRSPSESLT
ncbi:MAG: hypothetical protein QM817_03570 [Archangium sp.]